MLVDSMNKEQYTSSLGKVMIVNTAMWFITDFLYLGFILMEGFFLHFFKVQSHI